MTVDRLNSKQTIPYETHRNTGWKPLSAWEAPSKSGVPVSAPASGSLATTPQSASIPLNEPSHRQRSAPSSRHRKKHHKAEKSTNLSVRISQTDEKGQGVFATKSFSAGSIIIQERPFVTFEDPLTSLEVYTALAALSPENKDIFWSFKGVGAHSPTDVDIAETNLIPLEGDERCGMFKSICRLNHCCSPNARWIWSSAERKMTVWAICGIDLDEEITVSYLDPSLLLSPERKGWIESSFHFDCQCIVCTLDPDSLAQSISHRASIQAAFDRYENLYIDEWSPSGASPRIDRLNTLNEMDQIETIISDELLPAFLPRLLEYRFQLHAAWGEYEQAKKVGRQWEEEEIKCAEKRGPEYLELCKVRKDPRRWTEWGALKNLGASVIIERPEKKLPLYGRKAAG